jgi:hypothetical protein
MNQAAGPMAKRHIDVTGLPDEAVRAVESVVSVLKKQSARGTTSFSTSSSYQEWRKLFDAWMREVTARSRRYAAGFVLDDSRETIYEGRGE